MVCSLLTLVDARRCDIRSDFRGDGGCDCSMTVVVPDAADDGGRECCTVSVYNS